MQYLDQTAICRKQFLAGSFAAGAAAIAGTSALAHKAQAAESSAASAPQWDDEADVVIVGCGGGGLAAAVESSAQGKSVIVLEVMGSENESNSALCGGMIQGACTSVQKEAGIEDSAEEYEKFLLAVAEGMGDPDLIHTFAINSGATVDWLIEQGVSLPVENLSTFGTMVDYYTDVTPAVARMHMTGVGGTGITEPLYQKAVEQGVTFLFNTQATRLVTNAAGEVVGVQALAEDGSDVAYGANLAVIMNTAGFSRNSEMVRNYMTPAITGLFTDRPIMGSFGSLWQQGDGILMCQAVGAGTTTPMLAYNNAVGLAGNPDNNSAGFISYPGIYVGTDGKRHLNENGYLAGEQGRPTECVISDIWKQDGGFMWAIWDQSLLEAAQEQAAGRPVMYMSEDFSAEVDAGYVYKADTVEELAQLIEVDPDTLAETFETYNANAKAGTDEFERGDATPLETPPYYAGRIVAVSPDTAGGVKINTNAQVLNPFGEVIPRLYAVGNMTGGWKGRINSGCGQALGWTYTSGLLAARHACELEPLA